ncbi:YqaJ viral recombinase family protein, partial [Lactobacillus paracasei]|uniref:YqaJ viral recombinase family protein n=1 Tax=Lacticaseibacillus paracasei TaxID=1597 RepID=UPI0013770FB3
DLRRSGVGGSDIAKVLGLSPWGDSYSLWCEKTGDSVAAEQTSPLMEAGHYVELAADQWYRDKELPEGTFLRDARTWAHKDRRWQLANP